MPDQLVFAVLAFILLILIEFILGLVPGNPFKHIKVIGNVLRFQRSTMSRQVAVQKSAIRRVTITPGHLAISLSEQYQGRVLNLNFDRNSTSALFDFLQLELPHCPVTLAASGHASVAQ